MKIFAVESSKTSLKVSISIFLEEVKPLVTLKDEFTYRNKTIVETIIGFLGRTRFWWIDQKEVFNQIILPYPYISKAFESDPPGRTQASSYGKRWVWLLRWLFFEALFGKIWNISVSMQGSKWKIFQSKTPLAVQSVWLIPAWNESNCIYGELLVWISK